MNLEEQLAEHWPPHRVMASCGECGCELLDTTKSQSVMWQSSYLTTLIKTFARKHEESTGHANLDVGIDTNSQPVKEIEATITVNK